MTSSFYLVDAPGGDPRGPFTAAQIVGLHMTGRTGERAMVARIGEKQWYAISQALPNLQTVAQSEAAPMIAPAPVTEKAVERVQYVPAKAESVVIKSNPATTFASGFFGCLVAVALVIAFLLFVLPYACSAGFKAAGDQLFKDTKRPSSQK